MRNSRHSPQLGAEDLVEQCSLSRAEILGELDAPIGFDATVHLGFVGWWDAAVFSAPQWFVLCGLLLDCPVKRTDGPRFWIGLSTGEAIQLGYPIRFLSPIATHTSAPTQAPMRAEGPTHTTTRVRGTGSRVGGSSLSYG